MLLAFLVSSIGLAHAEADTTSSSNEGSTRSNPGTSGPNIATTDTRESALGVASIDEDPTGDDAVASESAFELDTGIDDADPRDDIGASEPLELDIGIDDDPTRDDTDAADDRDATFDDRDATFDDRDATFDDRDATFDDDATVYDDATFHEHAAGGTFDDDAAYASIGDHATGAGFDDPSVTPHAAALERTAPTRARGLDVRDVALRGHASWLGRIDVSLLWRRTWNLTTQRDEMWLVGTWRL